MIFASLAQMLAMRPDFSLLILTFFAYSFMGYVMECIVLTVEKKKIVVNRGFTTHLPFCIIYAVGAMVGFIVLSPLRGNLVLLYFVGAIAATGFEFAVGTAQKRLFGGFWWDYSEKPFNYKGMLCLESTIFWGFVAIGVVRFLHTALVDFISLIPRPFASYLAIGLLLAYAMDFAICARTARRDKRLQEQELEEAYSTEHSL